MNLRDVFHAANDDITPSEHLISETLEKMAQTEAVPAKKRGYMRFVRVAAVAACCVVIAVTAALLHPDQHQLPADPPVETTGTLPQDTTASPDGSPVTTTTPADETTHMTQTTAEGETVPQTGTVGTSTTGTDTPQHTTTLSLTGQPETTGITSDMQNSTDSGHATITTVQTGSGVVTGSTTQSIVPPWQTTTYYTTTTHYTTTTYDTTTTHQQTTTTLEETETTTQPETAATSTTTTTTTAYQTSGTSLTTTTMQDVPSEGIILDYLTIGSVDMTVVEAEWCELEATTTTTSGGSSDLTFTEAEAYYGIAFYDALGGLSCNQDTISQDEGVLTYGNMNAGLYTPAIMLSVYTDGSPPGGEVFLDDSCFEGVGDVEVGIGILEPVWNADGTLASIQQWCAVLYYPNGTAVQVYAKGMTSSDFAEILTDLIDP